VAARCTWGKNWDGKTMGGDGGPVWWERGAEAAQSALDSTVGTRTVWPSAGWASDPVGRTDQVG
jgi:hypothetical protein